MLKSLLLIVTLVVFAESFSEVTLKNNKYDGLVIAINPQVSEDSNLVQKLQEAWTDASRALWTATNHRAYFGDITILVPTTWKAGNYNAAKNQTYARADVVIAEANPKFGDSPYTVQYGECEVPGEYIHLTPNYVTSNVVTDDYGPKGKTLVHEWAHLRWGVFDESPTEGYDSFYYDEKQKIQATRCPVSLTGKNIVIDEENGEPRTCQQTAESNWLPEDGCLFLPDEIQNEKLKASLMALQYRNEVITFCHNDPNDPINLHNHEAPNEHNRLCSQRSVWEVILSSDDFANDQNEPNSNINDVTPSFNVVQAKSLRVVLVLDISGSMTAQEDGESRFEIMIAAADMFIQVFTVFGDAVGIVQFSTHAQILSELVKIESQSNRDALSSLLPKLTGGNTCIGCGIEEATAMLSENGDASGGHIIVLTDGGENEVPKVADVADDVKDSDIIVDSIFVGKSSTNDDLWDLSLESGGSVMPATTSDKLGLMETFKALAEAQDGDEHNDVFQIQGQTYDMSADETVSGDVVLDSTIGKNTIFTFTWSQYAVAPLIAITDPNGDRQCSISISLKAACPSSNVKIDTTSKIVKFVIPDVAQSGTWRYQIHTDSQWQTINVMVTTMAADQSVDPIVVRASISATDVPSGKPVVVNAKVTQGYNPILGAIVEAEITSTQDGSVTKLDLYDIGFAPDVRKNDGVYSRYFTGFTGSGRYSVQVTVVGMGSSSSTFAHESAAAFNYGYVDSSGKVVLNPNAAGQTSNSGNQDGTSAQSMDAFKRIESAGGFTYSGPENSPVNDVFPPSKVIDLSAKQKDSFDVYQGIVLTFTAPGDDYDEGTAKSYDIRYTYDTPSTLSSSFTSGTQVTNDDLISGDVSNPSIASTPETFVVNITDIPLNEDLVTAAFALRATDDAGNTADVSNIAMVNLFLTPPAIACTDKDGHPTSTDPFEIPGDCTHFYQCSNGELNTIACKPGTVFNPLAGVCDHPEKVPACRDALLPHSDGNSVITNETGSATEPPSPDATPICVDADGKLTSSEPFPNNGDCTSYYQCSEGKLYEFTCPSGLVFNPTVGYCDFPQNVPNC